MRLQGKIAIVTGGARGIGAGIARCLAADGAMMMKLTRPEFRDLSPREIFLASVKQAAPLGREQTPEDIGKLTCFLASDDAQNITGQEIKVDGGITLRTGAGI